MPYVEYILPAALIALIVYLTCKAVFKMYFAEKAKYATQLAKKIKDVSNGTY